MNDGGGKEEPNPIWGDEYSILILHHFDVDLPMKWLKTLQMKVPDSVEWDNLVIKLNSNNILLQKEAFSCQSNYI